MRPNPEDIQWLRLLAVDSDTAVPDFNKSRLVAMGLAERRNEGLQITEKGNALVAGRGAT